MAGLMSRFSTIFKAKTSRMLDRAEDPGETLDYSYQRQLEMLQKVKRGVADVVTSKKRLQLQSAKLEESVVKLDGQARQALAAGREDLARAALERKALVQSQLQGLDQQIAQLEQQQQTLVDQERRLTTKVESFRTNKEVIKAQYSAAEAQVRIGEATSGLSEELGDVNMAVQRAQDKTEQMQARASAVEELVETGALDDVTAIGPGSTDLDRQLAQLSAGSQVDDELARLRAEVGSGQSQGQIASGGRPEGGAQ
jgi:phage shock protein A